MVISCVLPTLSLQVSVTVVYFIVCLHYFEELSSLTVPSTFCPNYFFFFAYDTRYVLRFMREKKHSDSEFKVLNEERLFFAKSQIKFIIS